MKRKLLIISLILSSLIFAQGDNGKNQKNKMGNEIEKMEMSKPQLTEEQQKDLLLVMQKYHKEMAPLRLMIEEKNIKIKMELLNDKVDWNKVDSLLKEKAEIEGKLEVSMLKSRLEMEQKFPEMKFGKGLMSMGMGKGQGGMNNKNEMMGKDSDFDGKGKMMDKEPQGKGKINDEDKMDEISKGEFAKKEFFGIELNDKQKNDIEIIKDKYEKQAKNIKLNEQEKMILIEKELNAEKIDWKNVEKIAKEKAMEKTQLELLNYKERKEISSITGFDMMPPLKMEGKPMNDM